MLRRPKGDGSRVGKQGGLVWGNFTVFDEGAVCLQVETFQRVVTSYDMQHNDIRGTIRLV